MIYRLIERVDVDGGYGDAIPTECSLGYFECGSKEEIEAYIAKWNHPYIYDVPYAALSCQELGYELVEPQKINIDIPPRVDWDMDVDSEYEDYRQFEDLLKKGV